MEHRQCLVLENVQIAHDYYAITFRWPTESAPEPGQFLTLRAGDGPAPLLRRPFAFSLFRDGTAEAIYQRRGPATTLLAGSRPGARIDVLAPLGHPFPAPTRTGRPILVAGGVGMGPIFFLADRLAARGSNPLLVVGARTVSLIPSDRLPQAVETVICTDDGSRGFAGTVVDFLAKNEPANDSELFACGPDPMLEALSHYADERSYDCWVSIEQTMGCAVGACMGCAVRIKGPKRFARVCTEGPIFRSTEIIWS